MRVLVADAHPSHAAANADAVEALLRVSGADVRRIAAPPPAAVSQRRKRAFVRRCIHPGGWAGVELKAQLPLGAAARSPWAGASVVVVSDGPVMAPAQDTTSTLAAGRNTLWVNAQSGDSESEAQALLAVGAVRSVAGTGPGAEIEIADPIPYAVLPRSGSRMPDELRQVIRALAAALRGWGVRVTEVAATTPHLHAYGLVELLDLPVALCHSTLRCFLAAADGRRIAAPLLREGLTHARRQRQELARLPAHDPRALVAAARGLRRATDTAEIYAPDRAYGRVLQAWQRGEMPHPATANELLMSAASRMGTNPVANGRVVQLSRRVRTSGFFASPSDLLAAMT